MGPCSPKGVGCTHPESVVLSWGKKVHVKTGWYEGLDACGERDAKRPVCFKMGDRGAWVAWWVEGLTFGFSSSRDLWVVESSPGLGSMFSG